MKDYSHPSFHQEIKICQCALDLLFQRKGESCTVFKYTVEGELKYHVFAKGANEAELDACFIKGNRIYWRTERASFLDGVGRWRYEDHDEKISFDYKVDYVSIFIMDNGNKTTGRYKL